MHKKIDAVKYPGALDLLQQCPRQLINELFLVLEKNDTLVSGDIQSLTFTLERENLFNEISTHEKENKQSCSSEI